MLLFVLLVLVFSIPAVQTLVAKKVTTSINESYQVDINVARISIAYNGSVVLGEVNIRDHHKNTLIGASELKTSILNLPGLIGGSRLDFGDVTAKKLQLNMVQYKGETSTNLDVFAASFDDGSPSESDFKLTISHIIATDSKFTYTDYNASTPEIISLDKLNIDAANLLVDNSDVFLNIQSLSTEESNLGLFVKHLHGKFSYTATHLDLENFLIETPTSSLTGDLSLLYTEENGLSDFANRVNFKGTLANSKISTEDLNLFYNEFGENKTFNLSSEITGPLNELQFSKLEIKGLDRSQIRGNLKLHNVTDAEHFSLSGNFSRLATNYYDLAALLPGILGTSLPSQLKEVGNLSLHGYVNLTSKKLITNAIVTTQLGAVNLDITLNNIQDTDNASYKGKIKFDDFNLGRFIGNNSLGATSFVLNVDGKGFSQEAVNTLLNGTISEFRFNGYTYRNIQLSGLLKAPLFNGELFINDPNLEMHFNGLLDVAEEENVYDFKATVAHANIKALHFFERDSIALFKGSLNINMKGTSLDNIVGEAALIDAMYENENDTYNFKELKIVSGFEEEIRMVKVISSDVIEGGIEGQFLIEEIPILFENALGSLYANYSPIAISPDQYLDFNFNIYNKIIEVIFPDIKLAPDTFVKGSVESSKSAFQLNFSSPQIGVYGNNLKNVNLKIDNSNPLFNTYVKVDQVETGSYNLSDVNLINVTLNDTLFMRTRFKGGKNAEDQYRLNFFHTIDTAKNSIVGVRPSEVLFKNNLWKLNKNNDKQRIISIGQNFSDIKIDTLMMEHQNEKMVFQGVMRDSTYKNFKLDFTNVDINKVTPSIDSLALTGTINGNLRFQQEKGVYKPTSKLHIDSLSVNKIPFGALHLDIAGSETLSTYQINALLGNPENKIMDAAGAIEVSNEASTIDLNVKLNELDLKAFDPFGAEVVSNLRGMLSGEANIKGPLTSPAIDGKLAIKKGGLTVPYLNVDYAFQEETSINLSENNLQIENTNLTDTKYKTKGTFYGAVKHTNFSEWNLDLYIQAPKRLVVLDTPPTEFALYYGTAFIGGNAHISGPTDELQINVTATTKQGTIFKIPLSDMESIADNSFIYFITQEEKEAKQSGREIRIKEVKGLELFFDLNVTDDAEVEIVVDQDSGSSMRGKGAGTLLMEINTNGKFKMWGDFVVYEGTYDFKYGGIIDKKFEVVSGGNITWDGNPTKADLNLRALYKTEANPAVLLENTMINRNIPVYVYIDILGDLTAVEPDFFLTYPNLGSVVKSELEYRIADKQSRQLQALSLIAQGSFLSPNSGTTAGNLLFEKASGLFDDIFSDEEGKFKVGLDYVQSNRSPDQNASADRFGLTLQTQINDRILINGRVGVPIGGVNESVVVGNVEIDFLLNEDGSLKASLFNRENNIQYIGEDLGYTQGVGLSYSVDFDTFRELIRKILGKEIKIEEVSNELDKQKEKPKSLAPDYIKFPGS